VERRFSAILCTGRTAAEEITMSDWETSLRDLKLMQERMNALLEESVKGAIAPGEPLDESTWIPAADAFETAVELLLLVDVPGTTRDDLRVDVEGGRLVVSGERKLPEGLASADVRRIERTYGTFSRSFELPATIDETRIKAEHRAGVLAIRLPKRESSRGRQFQVTVE
jgi:HSP20 family protein